MNSVPIPPPDTIPHQTPPLHHFLPHQLPAMTAPRFQQHSELQSSNICLNYRLSLCVLLHFVLSSLITTSLPLAHLFCSLAALSASAVAFKDRGIPTAAAPARPPADLALCPLLPARLLCLPSCLLCQSTYPLSCLLRSLTFATRSPSSSARQPNYTPPHPQPLHDSLPWRTTGHCRCAPSAPFVARLFLLPLFSLLPSLAL